MKSKYSVLGSLVVVAEDKADDFVWKAGLCFSHGECSDHLKPRGLCYNLLHAWLPAQAQRWPSEGVSVQRDSDTTGKGAERKLKRVCCFPTVQLVLWLNPLGALVTWLLYFVSFLCGRQPIRFPLTIPFHTLVMDWKCMLFLSSIFFFQGRFTSCVKFQFSRRVYI